MTEGTTNSSTEKNLVEIREIDTRVTEIESVTREIEDRSHVHEMVELIAAAGQSEAE